MECTIAAGSAGFSKEELPGRVAEGQRGALGPNPTHHFHCDPKTGGLRTLGCLGCEMEILSPTVGRMGATVTDLAQLLEPPRSTGCM